ncbi:MAG: glycosyltransferase family 39 protein [Dokdonella sp.]|uniref:glycosyltransferase family 39 protein n=1 Tax=Dokdonella sp. TaxID=2291710 RepID=UPI003265715D
MTTPASAGARRRFLPAALFLVLFCTLQALLWFAYYGHGAKALVGDERVYQDTAVSILAGGPWMPSSIWPPLQPLFIAAIYALFGPHLVAVQIAQTLLFVVCGALLRDVWRRLGAGVAAANAAAALWLLNPAAAAYAHWLWPELPHLTLLLAALCLLVRAPTRLRTGAAGLCTGLAMLAKSLLSVFWPLLLIVFVQRERPRFRLRAAAIFVFALAAITGPALLHGWRTWGTPMIADSSIYNLWVGLTDNRRSDYVDDMGGATLPAFLASAATPQQRNLIYRDKIGAEIEQRGIPAMLLGQIGRQYFRLFSAKTPLVSQLPGPACSGHLSVYRAGPQLTTMLTVANSAMHALLLALCAFGVACRRWKCVPDRRAAAILAVVVAFLAYQLALFLLIHVKARFLLPMLPFLCGFAGSFMVGVRERWQGGVGRPTLALTPLRLSLGAALATLLLFLAFAGPALDHLCGT